MTSAPFSVLVRDERDLAPIPGVYGSLSSIYGGNGLIAINLPVRDRE
jgi:hypothetical protein